MAVSFGVLTRGYREMASVFSIPAGTLRSGKNALKHGHENLNNL